MNNTNSAREEKFFSEMLHDRVVCEKIIGGGRNSKVFKLTCRDGRIYAGKVYFRNSGDSRNRLETEFIGLTFLRRNGIKNIPLPVKLNSAMDCAVYEFIDGIKIPFDKIGKVEIDSAVGFLKKLKKISRIKESETIGDASEACFSIKDILGNLEFRLERLIGVPKISTINKELHNFLENFFMPSYREIIKWSLDFAKEKRMGEPINRFSQTLSPSDFGFHNALLNHKDELIFLDFEYFGWDDPAKMISDFLLHPGMRLNNDIKHYFADKIFSCFSEGVKLIRERTEAVYPLFGLKWCLILLNDFVKNDILRRNFAVKAYNLEEQQMIQLKKTKRMLKKVIEEHEKFPYGKQ
jgi:thiamine kinase-like enzyme